ncbi:unnamed protein product [Spodoptera exigua]|nr:unnamed protein product [Spodoptera exigua]
MAKATTIKEAIKKWEDKTGEQAATATEELPHLEDLLFVGNPLYDGCELEAWRSEAARRLPNLKKLDGETVLREDEPPLTVADMQPDCGDGVETLVSAETND